MRAAPIRRICTRAQVRQGAALQLNLSFVMHLQRARAGTRKQQRLQAAASTPSCTTASDAPKDTLANRQHGHQFCQKLQHGFRAAGPCKQPSRCSQAERSLTNSHPSVASILFGAYIHYDCALLHIGLLLPHEVLDSGLAWTFAF